MHRGHEYFITGGTLHPKASCYVERRADRALQEELLRGELCYVLTPRQMGKSSLMVRAVVKLREAGTRVAVLDLTALGQNLTPEQWYDGLLARLGAQLDLEDELQAFWRAHEQWGPLQRLTTAFEQVVLRETRSNVVIFLDEIDTVRSLPFSADEFFAGIRECYNRRAQDPEFRRLTFGFFGVAAPSDLVRDTRITPFNVGRRIELHDFTEEETLTLVPGLPCDRPLAEQVLRRVYYWTSGQPFLTQRLCRALVDDLRERSLVGTQSRLNAPPLLPTAARVDQLCAGLFFTASARESDDNLVFVRERLLRSGQDLAALLTRYREVRSGKVVIYDGRDSLAGVLLLSGLVSVSGRLRVRNRIYGQVFNLSWIAENMPEAELRRQRTAFRRGVALTLAAVLVALGMLGVLVLQSLRLYPLELTRTLQNGNRLTLHAVDHGRRHAFELGRFRTAWLTRAFSLIPEESPLPSGKPGFSTQSQDDSLVFWLTLQDAETGAYLNFDWWSHVEIVDRHGCRFFGNRRSVQSERNQYEEYDAPLVLPLAPANARVIVASGAVSVFPRRDRTLTLQLFNLDAELEAEFEIPNPVYGEFPVWEPDALPAEANARGLEVALQDCELLITEYEWQRALFPVPDLVPNWQVYWQGKPSAIWELQSLRLSDPTGNEIPLIPPALSAGLCREEAAWKLTGVFARRPGAEFVAEESCAIEALSIPAPSNVLTLGRLARVGDLNVTLEAVCGPGLYRLRETGLESLEISAAHRRVLGKDWFFVGTPSPTNTLARGTIHAGTPFLVARVVSPLDTAPRLSLSARLADGAAVDIARQYQAGDYRFLCLPTSPGSRILEPTLRVDIPRTVAFYVSPPSVSGTNAAKFSLDSSRLTRPEIPQRDPNAPDRLIDLSEYYNAALTEDWHRQLNGNDLAHFAPGVYSLAGTDFDIRGVVQVGGNDPNAVRFPSRVEGIRVGRLCRRLHFLQASGWAAASGTQVGRYLVRYADGETASIPLVYGINTEDWWSPIESLTELPEADSVWLGANRASLSIGEALQLYRFTWENPRPDVEIRSLDFVSAMATPAPFLVALTADP